MPDPKPLPEGTDAVIEGAGASSPDVGDLAYEVGVDGADQPADEASETPPAGTGKTSEAGSARGPATTEPGAAEAASAADATASWAQGGAFFDRFADLKTQGYDQARAYAVQGKDKATGALDDLLRTINDAADQIDAKVGNQYGDYARRAASGIADFNQALKGKDVDDLFAEARSLIARAPAVAVGTAAALGFVVARLARAGLDPAAAPPKADAATKA